MEASDTGWSGTLAPPHVDCKWQTKFALAAGAKMEPDSFVRECERLSGRPGIGMISSLSSPKSPKRVCKNLCGDEKEEKQKKMTGNYGDEEQRRRMRSCRPKWERAQSRANMSGAIKALSKNSSGTNPSVHLHRSAPPSTSPIHRAAPQ